MNQDSVVSEDVQHAVLRQWAHEVLGIVDAGIVPADDATVCVIMQGKGVRCGAVVNQALQLVGDGGVVLLGPGIYEIEETIEIPSGRFLWGMRAPEAWQGLKTFELSRLDED